MECLDEHPTGLRQDIRPVQRCVRASRRSDAQYTRCRVANVFSGVEPKAGRHFIRATKDRKSAVFARTVRGTERAFPGDNRIRLVMDNASTHNEIALANTFGTTKAIRIRIRSNIHHTPKHGSWLNQVERELSIYVRQCLGERRIDSLSFRKKEIKTWNRDVNRTRITADWKFTVKQAGKKFRYKSATTSRSRD